MPITKILIANRGEIACRVMRTAKKMGIATVAVYSDADARAPHVLMADEAVHIGPSPAAQSYLIADKIIEACKKTGADAVHPGYGFLSERESFRKALDAEGIIFVGPPANAIAAMGDKIESKKLAKEAGVNVVPGYVGVIDDTEHAVKISNEIGYPVMMKASAGGGGKGMRLAYSEQDVREGFEATKREGLASFGDDRVFIEKFIESPRHIEIQILGDQHGNIVYLNERECSIQRRHQKVVEEAPSPFVSPEMRQKMGEQCVALARAVGYFSAGTVELIVSGEDKTGDGFYFLEMNTRLQVEHPVTEEITGVDLVEWQLRVASGEPIPLAQDELSIEGHAIEARLYAEDPARGFLPSTGRLDHLDLGRAGRIETGVEQGDTISPFYDPMVAKLVAWGETRDDAIDTLLAMADGVEIWPVRTNAAFLANALGDDDFAAARLDTGFIERKGEALIADGEPGPSVRAAAAELVLLSAGAYRDPLAGFRLNRAPRLSVALSRDGESQVVDPAEQTPFEPLTGFADADRVVVFHEGQAHEFGLATRGSGAAAAGDGAIVAPMPGKVIAVDVAEGDAVKKGDRLLVLEAMKMEHALTAPFDGRVTELSASEGAQVQVDAVLAVVEPAE